MASTPTGLRCGPDQPGRSPGQTGTDATTDVVTTVGLESGSDSIQPVRRDPDIVVSGDEDLASSGLKAAVQRSAAPRLALE